MFFLFKPFNAVCPAKEHYHCRLNSNCHQQLYRCMQESSRYASFVPAFNITLRYNKLCAWRHNMPPPLSSPVGAQAPRAPPSRRNVAVLSHAEYVLTLTAAAALRVRPR